MPAGAAARGVEVYSGRRSLVRSAAGRQRLAAHSGSGAGQRAVGTATAAGATSRGAQGEEVVVEGKQPLIIIIKIYR